MSDYRDLICILAVFGWLYVLLRWVDYRGTRVAARHPRSRYVTDPYSPQPFFSTSKFEVHGSQVIEPLELPVGFDPPSAAPWPSGLPRH